MNLDSRAVGLGVTAWVLLVVVRGVLLASGDAPATTDTGNWLAYADDLLGDGVRTGVAYPPAVPLVSRWIVDLFGPQVGVAVLGSLACLLPGAAALVVLGRMGEPGLGSLVAIVASGSAALGEVVAWGGFPQAFGLSGAILAVPGTASWLMHGRPRDGTVGLAGWMLTTWSSHLLALALVVSMVVLLAAVSIARPDRRVLRRAVVTGMAAAAVTLPLVPTYAHIVANLWSAPSVRDVAALDARVVLGNLWPLWLVAVATGPLIAAIALVRSPATARDVLAAPTIAIVALALGWSIVVLVSSQSRYLYDFAVLAPVGSGVAVAVGRWAVWPRLPRLAVTSAALALAFAGVATFPGQVDRYRLLTADTMEALDWLRDERPSAGLVAVPDQAGAPLGWWAEGVGRRPTLMAADHRWLLFRAERQRATLAGRLFYSTSVSSEESVRMARANGVQRVLVPAGGPWSESVDRLATGWHVAFRSGSTVILALDERNALP